MKIWGVNLSYKGVRVNATLSRVEARLPIFTIHPVHVYWLIGKLTEHEYYSSTAGSDVPFCLTMNNQWQWGRRNQSTPHTLSNAAASLALCGAGRSARRELQDSPTQSSRATKRCISLNRSGTSISPIPRNPVPRASSSSKLLISTA